MPNKLQNTQCHEDLRERCIANFPLSVDAPVLNIDLCWINKLNIVSLVAELSFGMIRELFH